MSTTLDHTSFPHLLDCILAHSSHTALLTLRATSRDFRRRADSQLCHHVELRLSANATDIPSWAVTAPGGARLPLLPGDTHGHCLSTAKVLTLRTPHSQRRMARKDLLLPALYLSAHTVRLPDPFVRLSIDGLAPRADRLVVFEEVGRSFNCDKTGWFFPPTVAGTKIPAWARRYTLNIAVRPDEPELHAATWEKFAVLGDDGRPLLPSRPDDDEDSRAAREVTVILRRLPGRTARPLQDPLHQLGLLHGLVGNMAHHPGWKWSLVGVADLLREAPQAFPALAGLPVGDVYARIEEEAGTHVEFWGVEEYMRARGAEGGLEVHDIMG